MNNENIILRPETEQDMMNNILFSLKARHDLLGALNQRIEMLQGSAEQQLQERIGDLKQQQLADIDTYRADLLVSGRSRQEYVDEHSIDRSQSAHREPHDWTQQFADGFVAYLTENDSPLLSIWLGERYSYPNYIGFDLRKLGDEFNFQAPNSCWIALSLYERQVFAGVHFRNPLFFQELERYKTQIDAEFLQEFGRKLEWKPTSGAAGIFRINLLVGVDDNANQQSLFESLCKYLEKLMRFSVPDWMR